MIESFENDRQQAAQWAAIPDWYMSLERGAAKPVEVNHKPRKKFKKITEAEYKDAMQRLRKNMGY